MHAYTVSSAHAALTSIVATIQAGCVNGDPVCSKLQTYAGWVPGWLQYAAIIGIGLALLMAVIGHRAGWDHLRGVVGGVLLASILIGAAGTIF
jgi:type IV secretory pathway VirB2 component (pilin)